MRVNSYKKFFAEVAKIMNTEVKSVKQLDGRYKVELSNHVYLNVYRGVSGTLFLHDHRGIAHITSCYDFDDFKTMKELYERLMSDYSESTNTAEKHYDDYTSEDFINAGIAKECTECPDFCEEDCIENAECARGNDVFDGCKQKPPKGHIYIDTDSVKVAPLPEQQTSEQSIKDTIIADDAIAYQNARVKETKKSVLDVMQCMMCSADREGNRCGGKQWCGQTWKRYDAIVNTEWHHVSLNTLANLDFDMFDEKRQRYFTVYRELQETLTRLRKCKTLESYDNCLTRLMRRKNVMWARGEISNAMWHFIEVKLSMQNVESGIWGSYNEKSTGYHKSRRYNKSRA